jgi:alkylation response protein AidB-like acyl-CoA dehydrogenase
MDFAYSDEQEMLRGAAAEYLADSLPAGRGAELADSEAGWDPESWARIGALGWLELADTGDTAGQGSSGFLDESVLFTETGRALYPGPFFSTVALARPALVGSDLLAPVLAGKRTATLAWAESSRSRITDPARTVADRSGDSARLTGKKFFVPDAAIADIAVVTASDGLYAVDLTEHRQTVQPRPSLDGTRRVAELTLDATPAIALSAGLDVLSQISLRALAALACEAVGISQAVLHIASEHAKQRKQFDRAIGSYQAVSHKIADGFVALELARSLSIWAAWTVSAGDPEAAMAVAAAKATAADAAVTGCENAIQVLGGIGFTYESVLHRYYRRAQAIRAFDGQGAVHRAEIARVLLDA